MVFLKVDIYRQVFNIAEQMVFPSATQLKAEHEVQF